MIVVTLVWLWLLRKLYLNLVGFIARDWHKYRKQNSSNMLIRCFTLTVLCWNVRHISVLRQRKYFSCTSLILLTFLTPKYSAHCTVVHSNFIYSTYILLIIFYSFIQTIRLQEDCEVDVEDTNIHTVISSASVPSNNTTQHSLCRPPEPTNSVSWRATLRGRLTGWEAINYTLSERDVM